MDTIKKFQKAVWQTVYIYSYDARLVLEITALGNQILTTRQYTPSLQVAAAVTVLQGYEEVLNLYSRCFRRTV
jgi:hypothetical protein